MPSLAAIPVDHQPDFGERWAGVPVDHDPFADDAQGMANQGQYALMASRLREMAADHRQAPADQAAMMPETYANPLADTLIQGAMAIPKRAFEASETYRQGGDYNPGPILEAAMLPMGTGALAGVPMRAGEAVLGAGPIRAYHGSPHDFDKFSLDKIGTGEGAQAYGHGLYFAQNEGVAKSYRDQLSQGARTGNGPGRVPVYSVDGKEIPATPATDIAQMMYEHKIDPSTKDGADWLSSEIGARGLPSDATRQELAGLAGKNIEKKWQDGRMYEVNINEDPDHFLDWDKPLSEQHPTVQKSFQPIIDQKLKDLKTSKLSGQEINDIRDSLENKTITGRELYMESAPKQFGSFPDRPAAASVLNKAGIPGIKYLDQGSRGAGEGSRNYVVFDHDLVNIVRKYAIAGIALPPAIAAQYRQMLAGQPQ